MICSLVSPVHMNGLLHTLSSSDKAGSEVGRLKIGVDTLASLAQAKAVDKLLDWAFLTGTDIEISA